MSEKKKMSIDEERNDEYINFYRAEGLNIIPLNPSNDTNKPLIEWQKYQERKATDAEVEGWKEQTSRFAVVCGEISANLVILDIDAEELFEGLNLGAVAANTYTEEKARRFHIFLRTAKPIATKSLKFNGKEDIGILSTGHLTTAGGTAHTKGGAYTHFITSPKEIKTVDAGFFGELERLWREYRGLATKSEKGFSTLTRGIKLNVPILEIIKGCVELKNLEEHGDYLTCRCPFRDHSDLTPSFTIYKKSDSFYCFGCDRGGNPIDFISEFYGISKKKATERLKDEGKVTAIAKAKAVKNGSEEKIIIQTSLIEDNGIMYEEIYRDKAVSFIDSAGKTYNSVEVDGTVYEPITGSKEEFESVKLPSSIEDYETEEALIKEIITHIHKYTDISPFFETISAYYIFLTWLYDELSTLPYLRVLGDTGCGKSRYEDTVGRLCYKATFVSGALTPAPIYRLIGKWGGTIIIDEGDFKNSNEKNEVIKILNCGYERGRAVCRCQADNPDNIFFLPTFSPKLISSRQRFNDTALESRCLTEIMVETSRDDIPYLLPSEFYEEEVHLRNKLLNFRFRNHGTVDIKKAQGMSEINAENRLKQVMSPFMILFADNTEVYTNFVRFIEGYNGELVEVRAETIEGAIVESVLEIIKKVTLGGALHANVTNVPNVTFDNDNLKSVYITSADITTWLQENHGLKEVTSRSVGRRLKTLGISTILKKREGKVGRFLLLKAGTLAKLKKKYVPSSPEEGNVKYISNVDMKDSPPSEKNVCDNCGRDRITTELNGQWLCDDCITEISEFGEEEEQEEQEEQETLLYSPRIVDSRPVMDPRTEAYIKKQEEGAKVQ